VDTEEGQHPTEQPDGCLEVMFHFHAGQAGEKGLHPAILGLITELLDRCWQNGELIGLPDAFGLSEPEPFRIPGGGQDMVASEEKRPRNEGDGHQVCPTRPNTEQPHDHVHGCRHRKGCYEKVDGIEVVPSVYAQAGIAGFRKRVQENHPLPRAIGAKEILEEMEDTRQKGEGKNQGKLHDHALSLSVGRKADKQRIEREDQEGKEEDPSKGMRESPMGEKEIIDRIVIVFPSHEAGNIVNIRQHAGDNHQYRRLRFGEVSAK